MYKPTLEVVLDPGAYMPRQAHEFDAGFDLFSPIDTILWGGNTITIDTGVHIEIPEGYVGMLKSKSGLNVKHDITSEGVIDSGYTGSICVKLYNHGQNAYEVNKGDKISQLVIMPIFTPALEIVSHLDSTERGDGGFGSTGK